MPLIDILSFSLLKEYLRLNALVSSLWIEHSSSLECLDARNLSRFHGRSADLLKIMSFPGFIYSFL